MRAPHRERRSPAHPSAARAAWLFVLNAAVDAAGDPAVQPYELIGALRGLSEVNFPLAAGDARRRFVKAFCDQARAWCEASATTRKTFAGVLAEGARALQDLMVEQGTEIAAAARARMGFGCDDA